MTSPTSTYRKKPQSVEAFYISYYVYSDALKLRRVLPTTFYVPAEADHALRRDNEDTQSGLPYQSPAFVVITDNDGNDVRVDQNSWVVVYADKSFETYSDKEFEDLFESVS